MRVAYFDCFAGASGNMIAGAFLDAGLSQDALERELRKLPVSGWTMHAAPVAKRGLGALYLDVDVPGEDRHRHDGASAAAPHRHEAHAHRTLRDVLHIVHRAGFPAEVERTAASIYRRLAEAEARVHRQPVDEVAFHEVGQIDAIVDIASAALALSLLGIDRVHCSALPCGRGTIFAQHGMLPSPAPATMELLRGVPTYAVDVEGELVTPTGAAILTVIADFSPRPPMTVERVGYGAGRSDFPFPNVLRVVIGKTEPASRERSAEPDDVVCIETNIDDMNPQLYEHVVERLFAAGALDAWTANIQMKKGRPGTQVCVLASPERADALAAVLLAETTTLGVRRWTAKRDVLARETVTIETTFGPVRVKVARTATGLRAKPEYDDCRAIARRDGLALTAVMHQIEAQAAAWLERQHA